jgi:hypothetical protein
MKMIVKPPTVSLFVSGVKSGDAAKCGVPSVFHTFLVKLQQAHDVASCVQCVLCLEPDTWTVVLCVSHFCQQFKFMVFMCLTTAFVLTRTCYDMLI